MPLPISVQGEVPVADNLFETTIDLLWRQWRAIGGGAATNKRVSKQVDPEVLCLVSLVFRDHEARLWSVMSDWLRFGASLLSVQRIKNLTPQFPVAARDLEAVAEVALHEGKDARWKSLLERRRAGRRPARAGKQRSAGVAITDRAALVLRMRAAFNVGLKADLFAFLLGQAYRVTVSAAASALSYGVPAVFRALQDLLDAEIVRSTNLPAAAEYWVERVKWFDVLGGADAIADWGYWREVLVYACAAFDLERRRDYLKSSEYARATALRELAQRHEAGLMRSGLVEQGIPSSATWGEWRDFHNALAGGMAKA